MNLVFYISRNRAIQQPMLLDDCGMDCIRKLEKSIDNLKYYGILLLEKGETTWKRKISKK